MPAPSKAAALGIASLGAMAWLLGSAAIGAEPAADVVIRGGTIYDGSAAMKPYVGDVAISGERIVYVGPHATMEAKRVIDAAGMVVSPGFLDPHTHPDRFYKSTDPAMRQVPAWIAQGVSTIFVGVDGAGSPDVADTFARVSNGGTGVNVISYVGFGPIRTRVIGEVDRAPNPAELEKEKALVAKGMCEGAIGFSTGLFYVPQSYSKTDEVIALGKVAAKYGAIYDTHTRDYSDFTVGAIKSYQEALDIGKATGMPVHLSHIKIIGPKIWGKSAEVVKMVDAARAAGQSVTSSQYPYSANGTSISAIIMPNWALDGGREALLKRMDNPETLDRLKKDMTANLERTGGANKLLLAGTWSSADGKEAPYSGKFLDVVAREWGLTPVDAALKIVKQGGNQSMIGFVMGEQDIENFMKQSWNFTDSDGSDGHPREYGTYPTKYRKYVVEQKAISLPFFIRSSTGAPADFFGVKERGYLKPGYFADVLVFDPKTYAPKSDFSHWNLLPTGVIDLFVNGKAAIDGGRMTAVLSGRTLPHASPAGTCG
ncbi:amidohydrolase family protein [Sphingomonas sp. MMS24-J13]|uniref:N-acyl-D-amino-acid deacylase family protein n=1 Tax=Sphingomonas sp. MMS24-J13 TaxID=3238686 RepID=UPI003850B4D9